MTTATEYETFEELCRDLAQMALVDEPSLRSRANELAKHIEGAIEDWIEDEASGDYGGDAA